MSLMNEESIPSFNQKKIGFSQENNKFANLLQDFSRQSKRKFLTTFTQRSFIFRIIQECHLANQVEFTDLFRESRIACQHKYYTSLALYQRVVSPSLACKCNHT